MKRRAHVLFGPHKKFQKPAKNGGCTPKSDPFAAVVGPAAKKNKLCGRGGRGVCHASSVGLYVGQACYNPLHSVTRTNGSMIFVFFILLYFVYAFLRLPEGVRIESSYTAISDGRRDQGKAAAANLHSSSAHQRGPRAALARARRQGPRRAARAAPRRPRARCNRPVSRELRLGSGREGMRAWASPTGVRGDAMAVSRASCEPCRRGRPFATTATRRASASRTSTFMSAGRTYSAGLPADALRRSQAAKRGREECWSPSWSSCPPQLHLRGASGMGAACNATKQRETAHWVRFRRRQKAVPRGPQQVAGDVLIIVVPIC